MHLPTIVKALPTLRGLRIQSGQRATNLPAGTLFTWDQVGRSSINHGISDWTAYDGDGREVMVDGGKLCLRLTGARANHVAIRKQERHFRRAWRQHSLAISEVYVRPKALPLAVLLASCTFVCGLWFWRVSPSVLSLFGEVRSMPVPASYPVLLIIGAAFLPFMFLAMWLFVFVHFLRQRRADVASARFGPDGIQATKRDGTELELPWRMLVRASGRRGVGRLEFKDGTILRIPARQRSGLIVRILWEQTEPDLPAREHRASRNMILRIGVYMLVGIVLAGAIGYHLEKNYDASHGALFVGVGFTAVLALSALSLVLCLRINGYLNRRRKRTGSVR